MPYHVIYKMAAPVGYLPILLDNLITVTILLEGMTRNDSLAVAFRYNEVTMQRY